MNNNTITRPLEVLLTLNNPVFACYIFWGSVLVLKMLLMTLLTVLQRFRFKILALIPRSVLRKVFISPEDGIFSGKEPSNQTSDPHVERVRRAHRNDMENVLPFFAMGLMYICTDPGATLAMILFRIHGVARIIHTLVYAFAPVPQPTRAIVFYVALCVTAYMGLCTMYSTIKFV